MLWENYCPLMWFSRQTTYGAHGRRVVHLEQDIIEESLDGLIVLSLMIGFPTGFTKAQTSGREKTLNRRKFIIRYECRSNKVL